MMFLGLVKFSFLMAIFPPYLIQGGHDLFAWDKIWGKSYYNVLGVEETATTKGLCINFSTHDSKFTQEIKKAYRKLAITFHPDKMTLKTEDEKVLIKIFISPLTFIVSKRQKLILCASRRHMKCLVMRRLELS